MKRLLIPLEGKRYPWELIDFISVLNSLAPVVVTAAFVQESDYASMLAASGLAGAIGVPSYEREAHVVRQHGERLAKFCAERNIPLKIHLDQEDFALPSLRDESRYADLMLLSGVHFFEEQEKEQPNVWMKETLRRAECPVLLLPDNASLPGELILAYDGSADSVFAIRQFVYLFPELLDVPARLVYIQEKPETPIPDETRIRELCAQHFTDFSIQSVKMRKRDFYYAQMGTTSGAWLIAGSYGRTSISEIFSRSFSTELIHGHTLPVFIAHQA